MSPIDLSIVEKIAGDAGIEILKIYNGSSELEVITKADNSPLTLADKKANEVIVAGLQQHYPDVPIISEEAEIVDYDVRSCWQRYWLVDPLDGTKEFIGRNGEFTVNIALIEKGEPVLGVVHVPVQGVTYSGGVGFDPIKASKDGVRQSLACQPTNAQSTPIRVVASRHHRGERLEQLLQQIAESLGSADVVSMGSSLKMCLLAEGKADFYPRMGPTSEWDTAAAHAVLLSSGGQIVDLNFAPLRYNQKPELLNPEFLAIADSSFDWQSIVSDAAINR
ncbi:MAG: 3'(2'),5'-bisphosphate nucleotidase CysQ [Pseudohongiellaceae bacterium]